MSTDTETLDAIYNAGERLVPGETHDRAEIVRHKSSYQLFRDIIESDIRENPALIESGITVLDIGCGTGHGTYMLDTILGVKIVGIDPSVESIQYAKDNYGSNNIDYINCDAEAFVSQSKGFDYVVSRHALEHVENGLNFALGIACRRRLMVNVPFNESEGNIHHLVHRIKEEHFDAYPNKEFFYEGLDGVTKVARDEEEPPNSIVCISSAAELKPVKELIGFPVPAWKPEFLQNLGIESLEASIQTAELLSLQKQTQLVEKEAQLENHHANLKNLEGDILRREAWVAEKEAQLANHEVNLNGIKSALVERELAIAEKEQQLIEHGANLEGIEAGLHPRQVVVAEAEGGIQRREAQVFEKEVQLVALESNLKGIQEDLARREAAVVEKEAQLLNHENNLNAIQEDLVRREAAVAEKEAQLLGHESNLNGIHEDLVRRNQEMSSSEQDILRREAGISEKEAQLTARELSAVEHEANIAHQNNVLSVRESQVRQSEVGAVEEHARLAVREKELAEMEVALAHRETLISNSLISKVALKLGSFRK
ncbi:methyltransferase domain-containing protein [Pseudomonas sp. WS 5532]|uniref:class I SAM-dependent methyltransferase n=1 Tax=unclassified Pseudomonas TaxID=196821 RepID=UPI00147356BA|nr:MULTISPECIES: class I SAM-dependent methyltransferase [unclassified Pseudomonas]NMX75149.1 methyltransferase domain-containing protein [Pseudomonas sp. WS 5532]QXI57805.1 methyltransferase domain-containing protein [Pseudomonas sp. OE 28.3]